jgi:hypothetical protein
VEFVLFVPPDAEGTDGIAGLGVDGSLTAELFEHLCGTLVGVSKRRNKKHKRVQHTVKRSPLSPTEMLRTNFWILSSFIGFWLLESAIASNLEESVGDGVVEVRGSWLAITKQNFAVQSVRRWL